MNGFAGWADNLRQGVRRRRGSWRELYRAEVGLTRSSYQIVDVSTASEAVRRRWEARQIQMHAGRPGRRAPPALLRRNVIASAVWTTGFGVATVVAEAGSAAILVPSSLIGLLPAADAGTALGGVAVVGGGATLASGWRYLRDPKRLRRGERRPARDAVWITPEALGYSKRKGIGRTTDEERLFHLALRTAENIVTTAAWHSSLLDGHRVRLDLDETLGQIGRRLIEIHALRREMADADGAATHQTIDGYRRSLDQAFDSIASRVVGLHGYLEQLRDLDDRLKELAQLEHAGSLSDRVLDVVAASAADDTAADQISALGSEAVDTAETIKSTLADLAETVSIYAFASDRSSGGASAPSEPDDTNDAPDDKDTNAPPAH